MPYKSGNGFLASLAVDDYPGVAVTAPPTLTAFFAIKVLRRAFRLAEINAIAVRRIALLWNIFAKSPRLHVGTLENRAYFIAGCADRRAAPREQSDRALFQAASGFIFRASRGAERIEAWDKIPVPSVWQMHGYEYTTTRTCATRSPTIRPMCRAKTVRRLPRAT